MPIAKGEPWGTPGEIPAGTVLVDSDAAARAVLAAGPPYPPIGLRGGDLCHTLGGGGGRLDRSEAVRFTIDVGEVVIDGTTHAFVAHLVARTRLWTRAFVAMNAQWLGDWNLGPRAHPNDGLLDTYDARLSLGQLLPVRARLHHGAHLPHPGIRERRTASLDVDHGRRLPVRLDGQVAAHARRFTVR
ncbi:MAG: hypothetical protein ACRD12_22745, partial [Acidimicrobiales bacterium]